MMTTVVDVDAARSEMLPLILEMATDGVSLEFSTAYRMMSTVLLSASNSTEDYFFPPTLLI
jgi:hypothetical protein